MIGHTDHAEGLRPPGTLPGIGGGDGTINYSKSLTVMVEPLRGLSQQTKYIPLRYCPLEIELELTDNDEPIVSMLGAESPFTLANIIKLWHIEQCQIKCDIVSLDNALDNSYVNHLLSGSTLNISYNTYIHSIQSKVSSDSTNVNVSSSLTSLRSVFIALAKNTGSRLNWYNQSWNNFYSPMAGNLGTACIHNDGANEITFLQLQIGSKLLPE